MDQEKDQRDIEIYKEVVKCEKPFGEVGGIMSKMNRTRLKRVMVPPLYGVDGADSELVLAKNATVLPLKTLINILQSSNTHGQLCEIL